MFLCTFNHIDFNCWLPSTLCNFYVCFVTTYSVFTKILKCLWLVVVHNNDKHYFFQNLVCVAPSTTSIALGDHIRLIHVLCLAVKLSLYYLLVKISEKVNVCLLLILHQQTLEHLWVRWWWILNVHVCTQSIGPSSEGSCLSTQNMHFYI